ncbi:MAG: hypothetical protein ACR2NZ_19335, partial [Rubripirellula sp.]
YDMKKDPDCILNLADQPEYAKVKAELWEQLRRELAEQGDPRIVADGDIFDYYPNARIDRQQKLYENPDYDPVQLFQERFGQASTAGEEP